MDANTLASVSDDPVPLGDSSVFDLSTSITGYFLSCACFRAALNKSMSSVARVTNAIYRPLRGVNTLAGSDAAFAGCDTSATLRLMPTFATLLSRIRYPGIRRYLTVGRTDIKG
jgi:hypothetical protein